MILNVACFKINLLLLYSTCKMNVILLLFYDAYKQKYKNLLLQNYYWPILLINKYTTNLLYNNTIDMMRERERKMIHFIIHRIKK
jgi:predicted small integral membrane protein